MEGEEGNIGNSESKSALLAELLQMGFPQEKITMALSMTANKEQAISIILAQKPHIAQEEDKDFEDQQEDYKMIFVVRMDLKLQLSKIAECVATAALKAYQQMAAFVDVDQIKEYAFFEWTEGGQRKIVVKAPSEKDLLDLIEKAKNQKMNFALVYEHPSNLKVQLQPKKPVKKEALEGGNNMQIKQVTANDEKEILILGAFGPAAESEIDPLTKHFKLL